MRLAVNFGRINGLSFLGVGVLLALSASPRVVWSQGNVLMGLDGIFRQQHRSQFRHLQFQ